MRFTMHRCSGFLIRRFEQAESLSRVGVVPVSQVFNPILFLNRKVFLVGGFNRLVG